MAGLDGLELYQRFADLRTGLFSRLVARGFGSFGEGSRIVPPVRVHGPKGIHLGKGVFVGPDSWLLALGEGRLEVGDGTGISGRCTLSAAVHVQLGREVLIGGNVYVADHNHGTDLPDVAIAHQELAGLAPVRIGDRAWLAQNSVVLAGVTVGEGAVVAANSVVLSDVPERTVVAGAPARVVSELPR